MIAHELIETEALSAWLDQHDVGSGPLAGLRALPGGTQNFLLEFSRAGRSYVLRRPGVRAGEGVNAAILREAAVLDYLSDTGVPHPRLVAVCHDLDVLGVNFFVMERVPGFSVLALDESADRLTPAGQHVLGLAVVDALVGLHTLTPDPARFPSRARPDGWLSRQVTRWAQQLTSYEQYSGWPGADSLGAERRAAALEEHLPGPSRSAVIHGDFHLGNILASPEHPDVAAIVDWELSTIGDPLVDLGHLLASWPQGEPASPFFRSHLSGLPDRVELVDRYSLMSGSNMRDVDWYEAFAAYRLAILLEGTHARACAGQASRDVGDSMHTTAQFLMARSEQLIPS